MTFADPLFRPFAHKGLRLPNRIVMAPMTRLKSSQQVPDEAVAAYYRRRAKGGVGLILTEGVSPEQKSASGYRRCPAFFGEAALEGWRKTAAAVTAAGGAIMPQLWHVGPFRTPNMAPYPDEPTLSPSGLLKPDAERVGEPMTDSQIADVIEGFAKSALYAKECGFAGVEIHGAHGYLIDTFFWPATNLRADGYGGSGASRRRFAIEIVKAVRDRVGPDFPILFRYSPARDRT
jgi:2,4-dienoyl-CoA reductase-like NADH-dependent reductase (Old Yellow Enzyme family)